ncbi:hypothetical protein BOO86_15200 [Mycobacterium sp. CBMA 234]|uniref:hypothetical protein n=1 Tax=Mycolicibacterium sp. CBMA 234 TaxID=1918495 RepID=UPI0012DFC046|nr:hypothetical protein [Mycolicibacterium sp. CBMA 234]MUL65820.1 hypothetical protein [Mycolicibacterium sp. CBMA 234]
MGDLVDAQLWLGSRMVVMEYQLRQGITSEPLRKHLRPWVLRRASPAGDVVSDLVAERPLRALTDIMWRVIYR